MRGAPGSSSAPRTALRSSRSKTARHGERFIRRATCAGLDGRRRASISASRFQHPTVIDAGIELLAEHVATRTAAATASIVETLKDEGAYPYPDNIQDPIREHAEEGLRPGRRHCPHVAASIQPTAAENDGSAPAAGDSGAPRESRRDPGGGARPLASRTRGPSRATESLRSAPSSDPQLEVSRRLDLLLTLRHFIYSPEVAPEMREVDQLHPLVRDNVWLFGEAWRLSVSEVGLTTVLRAAIGDDIVLESDLLRDGVRVLLPDGKRGRVDLLLQRTLGGPDGHLDRLVVELKRPSVKLGPQELAEVRRYAHALSEHPGSGPSRWTFWLVGSETKDEIGQASSNNRIVTGGMSPKRPSTTSRSRLGRGS